MSTDLRPAPPAPDGEHEGPAKPKTDLSLAQVLGGALAAMTAAFLGSRLSVAGTVIGAAMASVVAAVASSFYTASLRTTQEKVRTVFQGRVADSSMPATVTAGPERSTVDPAPTASTAGTAAARTHAPKRVAWKSIVLGALAAFAIAAAVLTGLEIATGQSLSGKEGTTVTQVAQDSGSRTKNDPAPADTASPSPSASASAPVEEPTAAPSASPSSAPSATPSAAEPIPTPSPSDTASPSATPVNPAPGADG